MRTRKMSYYTNKETGKTEYNVVFFGVKGVNGTDDNGYPIPIYDKDITIDETLSKEEQIKLKIERQNSYADGLEGISQSLNQRLSLIQGELYHFMNSGFPLIDKSCNKQMCDAYLINTILNHRDVISIKELTSQIVNHNYNATIKVLTKYGDLTLYESQII